MTQLYRIKPLEWNEFAQKGIWLAGKWAIHRFGRNFRGGHVDGERREYKSLEAAKAACESHRRKLLETELERVSGLEVFAVTVDDEAAERLRDIEPLGVLSYLKHKPQAPITDLPTEPGWYWYRQSNKQKWDYRKVIQGRERLLVVEYESSYRHAPRKGQWVRIPEPEVER